MRKKKQDRIEETEKNIISHAKDLIKRRPGGLNYRVSLKKIEGLICVRKGLLNLREKGDL